MDAAALSPDALDGLAPCDATIAALRPLIASGRLSAETLLDHCLHRIAAHDRQGAALAAILRLNPHARDEARALDQEAASGTIRGPLHGIPIVVKDNIDIAGQPTSSGCRALADAMPHRSAPAIDALRAAGAVIVGKTNLSEFSFEIRSRSSIGGDVRNPFDRSVTAGGSSGGTAAAVAAGFAIAGIGTDTGGSIRVPAAYTGLTGLRPTHGHLDISGVAPLAPSTDTIGPIARCAEDAAILYTALGGGTVDMTVPVTGLRLGVLRQLFGGAPEIGATVDAALAGLVGHGVQIVDPVTLPEDVLPVHRPHIVDSEFALAFDAYLAGNFQPGTAPVSLAEIVAGGAHLPDYSEALTERIAIARAGAPARAAILAYHGTLRAALEAMMARYELDAIAYPTSKVTPGSLDNPKGGWAPELAACSGWPALSVPAGRGATGMPIGLELLGSARSEALLLRLGAAIGRIVGPRAIPFLG